MGRQFVVLAALAAVMVSMSACKCSTGTTSSDGSSGSGTVCVDSPAAKDCDGVSCYNSEVDRDMGNLRDCRSHHGYCGCTHEVLPCGKRMPGTSRD